MVRGVIPSGLQPFGNFTGRFGRASQLWPLDPQNKTRVAGGFCALGVGALGFRGARVGFSGALPDGRVIRKVVQPEVPELIPNLAFGRIAMLVQRFQVTEDTRDFFPCDTELLGIHDSRPQIAVSVEAGADWGEVQNNSDQQTFSRFP